MTLKTEQPLPDHCQRNRHGRSWRDSPDVQPNNRRRRHKRHCGEIGRGGQTGSQKRGYNAD